MPSKADPQYAHSQCDTYPIGINDELEDIARISRQDSHGGPWDKFTVVLEDRDGQDRANEGAVVEGSL